VKRKPCPQPKETPESILLQRSDEQLVQQALEQLPVAYREVLPLCEVEEMSYQEISHSRHPDGNGDVAFMPCQKSATR